MPVIQMTSTSGAYVNGNYYRLRAKEAEALTKANVAKVATNAVAKTSIANRRLG